MSHLIADQFAYIHGARLQFKRRQDLRIDDIPQIGKNRPVPGQADGIADQHAGIQRPRSDLKGWKFLRK